MEKQLIDRPFPDPEQKAKAELELLRMERDGEASELAERMKANHHTVMEE